MNQRTKERDQSPPVAGKPQRPEIRIKPVQVVKALKKKRAGISLP